MKDGNAILTEEYSLIREELQDYSFITFDPLLQFQGGDENSNTHAGVMMGMLKDWAATEAKIILLIHHATFYNGELDKPKSRGAKEWVNGTRGTYSVKRLPVPKSSASKEEVTDFYEKVQVVLEKDNGLSSEIIRQYGSTSFVVRALPPMS